MRHLLVLKYIEKIAKTGSLRSAAEELGITPSALNRRVLGVEVELGVEIFERHPLGLRPNIAGEILLKYIRDQTADMERVKSRIADLSGMRAGHINIATTHEVASSFLPKLIQRHIEEFPFVTFAVNIYPRGEAEASLHDNSNDIAIIFEPIRLKELQVFYSGAQKLFCIMAENHPLAKKKILKIYDCANYPLMLPSQTEGIRQILDNLAEMVRIILKPSLESNSLELLQEMSKSSNLLSFIPAISLGKDLQKNGLIAVPLDTKGINLGVLVAAHLKSRALPVASARFLEVVNKELELLFD